MKEVNTDPRYICVRLILERSEMTSDLRGCLLWLGITVIMSPISYGLKRRKIWEALAWLPLGLLRKGKRSIGTAEGSSGIHAAAANRNHNILAAIDLICSGSRVSGEG